jgi:serine/threonine protein kinase
MGEVYRARDTRLDRDVAIKILPASVSADAERLARFEREAKAVAALSHPNILALHDAGTENGTAFAVMELLEGETLRERLTTGPTPRRAIETAIQIARPGGGAREGLIHRDRNLNVFLVADGQIGKILDFGSPRPPIPAKPTRRRR